MFTVVETPLFQKLWPTYWTEEERGEFATFLSASPDTGVVVKDSVAVSGKCAGSAKAQASQVE
jgi:hypothetical protein